MLIQIGLFQGDELPQRGRIKLTEFEQYEGNGHISLKHQLIENTALIELRVFDNGFSLIRTEAPMAKPRLAAP